VSKNDTRIATISQIGDFSILFQNDDRRHREFLKFRNCNGREVKTVKLRYRATFHGDQSSRCWNRPLWLFFDFSNMAAKIAAVLHLEFVMRVFGSHTMGTW